MASPLKQLKEVLRLRRHAQRRIHKLDSLLAEGTITRGHYDATVCDYRSRLEAADRALDEVRASIRSRLSDARKQESATSERLATLQARLETAAPGEEKLEREEAKLRTRLEKAQSRRGELEHMLAAESPADLGLPGKSGSDEEDELPNAAFASEFPGISVPERLQMLFREARNPESRRLIKVSGLILATLAVALVGVLAISTALADDDAEGASGKGEVLLPVQGDNLSGVGRVFFELAYDEDILTPVEIVPGILARARTVSSDLSTDGVVSVEIMSTYGFDPSGELVLVVFRVDDIVADRTEVAINGVGAFTRDGDTELTVQAENGWVDTTTFDVYAPVMRVT